MKLLTQTNNRYLLIYLFALIISSGIMFIGVQRLFNDYTNERLTQLADEITEYVNINDSLPPFFQSTSAQLTILHTERISLTSFGDTMLFNRVEQEDEPYRRLRFMLTMRGAIYQVDLLQSVVETEDIVSTIVLLNLVLFIVILIVLFWAQKRISKQLWRPFYDTLERLRSFHLNQKSPLALTHTHTDEFTELNTTLVLLTEKIRQDYYSLKRFTENASHEIQTPLAVIQARLEILFQSEDMNDLQIAHLHNAQRAAARLSRLQQSLLLLVKIENNQFEQQKIIDLKSLLESRLELLEDFIIAKNLRIQTIYTEVQQQINPFLAETLIGNLLGNAVKHNLSKGGWLKIQLFGNKLVISNGGYVPESPAAELIERFRRSNIHAEGLGLGLAIVKEICDVYNWVLEIKFENSTWTTSVHF